MRLMLVALLLGCPSNTGPVGPAYAPTDAAPCEWFAKEMVAQGGREGHTLFRARITDRRGNRWIAPEVKADPYETSGDPDTMCTASVEWSSPKSSGDNPFPWVGCAVYFFMTERGRVEFVASHPNLWTNAQVEDGRAHFACIGESSAQVAPVWVTIGKKFVATYQ